MKYSLTNPQNSIWLTEKFYSGKPINNISGYTYISEEVDFKALTKAINEVVKTNDAMRIKIKEENNSCIQYFSEYSYFDIETIELSSEDKIEKKSLELAKIPFAIQNSNLFKFTLFKLPNNYGGFFLTAHHLIGDSWSLGLAVKQIMAFYSSIKNNTYEEKEHPSYTAYIEDEKKYLESDKFNKDKEYWNTVFKTVPEKATIPSLKKNNTNSCDGNRVNFSIENNLVNNINEFCKENRISLYNFFMAVYSLYLGRVSGLDDFVIGTPILNRTNFEQKNTMGMFISTAPLRINLNHEVSFVDFVKEIATNTISLFRHQKYPYQYMLEDLRKADSSIPNLYNVVLSYQITKTFDEESGIKYRAEWLSNSCCADDLQIHLLDINDDGKIHVSYDYKTDKYDNQDIADLHARILTIINQVMSNDDVLLKEIEIVTPEEKHQILYEFNNTKVDYPRDKTIVDLFEEQVEKTPDNIAVVFEDQKLTYKELNEKANQLANYLISKNVKNGDVVALFFDKSLEVVISILATLKIGATYLPLDIEYPQNRIEYILNNSSAKVILTRCNEKDLKTTFQIIYIDNNIDNKYLNFKHNTNIRPSDLAYITYTSGSTGNPKGVMVTHRNVIRLVKNSNFITFSACDRILQTGSIVFDASTFEIFGALLNGLSVYLMKKENLLNPELFKKYITENNITTLFLTTALFNKYCEYEPTMFNNLKYLLTGGEAVSNRHMQIAKNKNINLNLLHVYGPTENTTFSTYYQVKETDIGFPIGKPITNSTGYIVDSYGKLCPIGVPGELWVGGDGVAKGYLNNETLTKEKFIQNPFDKGIIYKTGDLVKLLPDGNIEFIGRIDNQVKIRGFRIELSEIDTNILTYPNIKQSISIVQNINNNKTICSYIVVDKDVNIHKLKAYLSKTLANYMIPTYITVLDKLPLNINGKIDRKLLPLPEITVNNENVVKPRNDIDKIIISCLKETLGISSVNITDSFFDIGVDSLSGINLAMNISKKLQVSVTVRDIFEYPTIQALSDYIATINQKEKNNVIPKADKMQYYPLSSAQKRIYLASSIENDSTLYNITGGIIVDKSIDINKLQTCFNTLINRHEVLRTHFEVVNDEIVQIVDDNINFKLSLENSISDDLNEIYNNFVNPFDLSKAPLFRTKLVKLNDNKILLLLDMHHIISDGTSLKILMQELCSLYNGEELSNKNINYTDFCVWEHEQFKTEEFNTKKEFWVNQFKDEIPLLNMPTTYSRPSVQSFEGTNYYANLSEETINKILETSNSLNITPYMLMLACYYILLSKYTSQDDIVVGTPIAGRELPELSNMLGMFVNTLALRNKIDSSLSFEEFSKNIKENCLNSFKNQSYPFDMLVKDLDIKRDPSRNPLFDTMFSFQNEGFPDINFKDINSECYIPNSNISKFDISLDITPKDREYLLRFEYCTKLFDEEFIARFSSHYINILNAIIDNSQIKISDIDMLSEKERNQILYEFNNTKVDYPRDKTIVDLFEEQVEKTPDNIAVVFEDHKLTYRELNEKANQLANYLKELDVKTGNIISILFDRSLEILISILAVLKTGAAYLPLDHNYPKDRLEYIFNDCKSKYILTDDITQKDYYDNVIIYNCTDNSFENYDSSNLKLNIPVSSPSYLIYTSGSTGTPKGVILKHLSLTNLAYYCNDNIEYLKNPEYISIVSITTVSFDIFIFETLISLQKGLKIVIANSNQQNSLIELNKLIQKENIKVIQTTPSRMQVFYNNRDILKNLKKLEYIILAGEPLTTELSQQLKRINGAKIYNGYGPSETTVFATLTDVTYKEDQMTIGRPLYNTNIYILNQYGNLCPIGVPGEIYISGDNVGLGYINSPKLTTKSFLNNPFSQKSLLYKSGDFGYYSSNGEIICCGRVDNQIKIRGLRIELKEIDTNILTYPNIKQSISIVQNINNNKTICSYIVANNDINIHELKAYLSKTLANYMIPTYITILDKLPLNINGKVDRKLLPLPEITVNDENVVKPRNDIDKIIISCLKETLGISSVSIIDSFFDIGGDSLSAITLGSKLTNALKHNITVQDIFNNPIIKDLSDYISNLSNSNVKVITKYDKLDVYPLSSVQNGIYYASNLDNNSTLYNTYGGIVADKELDIEKLENCFNILINRHEVLRTHFELKDASIVQIIDDNIDFNLNIKEADDDNIDKIYKEFVKSFDLSKAPLFRAEVVYLKNNKMLLLLDMHHIISDGVSLKILMQELCDLYNGKELSDKTIDYTDFCLWEHEQFKTEEFNNKKEFWVNKFKDEVPLLNMPTTYPRPAMQSFEGKDYKVKLSKDIFNKINEVSKALNITPYMLMLSCYYILLSKYSSQNDIVVGSPIFGRELPELSNVLGMFVNTLALRNTVEHGLSFEEFSTNIKNNCLEYFKNQSYPFDMLVKELKIKRDPSRNPLFDTVFVYQNEGYPQFNINGINAEYYTSEVSTSKFDLTLEVVPNKDEYTLRFEYCTKLFDKNFITRLSSHYINILNAILENNQIKISDIDMLSTDEREKILYGFNNIEAPTNDDTFVTLFENQVKKHPNNVALICDNKSLTYSELNEKANSLAHFLLAHNVKQNDIIAIMTDRSLETIVCMLGILKAGAAFVNMDPTYPIERTTYYLNDCKAKCVLKQKHLDLPVKDFENIYEIDLDNDIYKQNKTNPNIKINLDSLSYIIYTSGSTGVPKGVVLNQLGLANMCKAMTLVLDYLKDGPNHAILSVTSTPFDIFVYEITVSLSHGMRVVLANNAEHRNPKLVDMLIRKHGVDVMTVTPSLMKINYDNREPNSALAMVKNMVFGGEPLSEKFVNDLKSLSSDITIYNIYGPSEITVLCNVQNLEGEKEINIGPPILNNKIYILDNDMNPLPIGFTGEIYIGGIQVGCGYLGKEDLTNEKFINNPFAPGKMFKSGDIGRWTEEGKLQCLGRIDHQIKLRGLRVELGEIEKILEAIPEVDEAVVNKVTIDNKEALCAYYVLNSSIDEALLRNTLREKLPYYMVPTYFTKLDKMPYSINRKIDRKALPIPTSISTSNKRNIETVNSLSTTSDKLLFVWKNVLHTNDIDVNDNFFDVGGDSISAIQVQIEAVKLGINIEYSDIFKYPTIKQLSGNIKSNECYDLTKFNDDKIQELLKNNNNNNLSTIHKAKFKNVLIIGTTGYLGIHLIHEFLTNCKGKAYCLIRPKNNLLPEQRLEDMFTFYFGKNNYEKYKKRIVILKGDITMDNLGLSMEDLDLVKNKVDVIINSGALVKHYGTSKLFEDINVLGTQNVVSFCTQNNKRLLHISTISVSGNGERLEDDKNENLMKDTFTESDLYIGQQVNGIYTYTKFQAEHIVLNAIAENNLNAMIFRVGNITNRFSDGLFQRNFNDNAFAKRIKSFIEIGAYPDYLLEHTLELSPVDLCAKAIIKALQYESNCNVLHIYNSHLLEIKIFIETLNELNIKLTPVSNKLMRDIITGILEDDERKEIVSGIIYDLDKNKNLVYTSSIKLNSDFSNKYLAKIGFYWKKTDKRYLKKCMKYFKEIGFIDF